MSTIELQNLTKAFGDLIAVNDVSLKVEENEVLLSLIHISEPTRPY